MSDTSSRSIKSSRWAAGAALCMMAMFAQAADEQSTAPIEAGWKTQEIRYAYTGFTTAYSCDSAERKVKDILLALGAHAQTRVRAQGCIADQPSRNFFFIVTTATPVPLADRPAPVVNTSREELLKRLGVASKQLDETFPAQWQTISLVSQRKLDIEAGDCELLQGLRDFVLPKISVKVLQDDVNCVPNQIVSYRKPDLKVSALVKAPSADVTTPKRD